MRAKGKSPTSAIAPPASIENHGGGQSSSRISPKLRGCQQSQISSSQALELPCKAGASALCLARLQPSIQAVFLATTDRWHNRNFCSGRNSRGKSTGVTHILVGHKNIHVPSSFARLG